MLLDGIRILDFSQYIPGSYASLRLAKLGAEVIKVEPLTGDPTRYFGKEKEATGVIFAANNRYKKSICINLKEIEGSRIAKELIQHADIVIENFRTGVMERFGLHYERIKELNKGIIYLSLSGYGQNGAMSAFGSHDLNFLSLSGVLSQLRDKTGRPILPKLTFADIIGGMAATENILAALYKKERTGLGEHIDLSLMDAILSLMNINIFTSLKTGKDNVIKQLDGELISYNIYQTKDNRYVSLAALEPKFWINFCNAVEKEEWIPAHLSMRSADNKVYEELTNLFLSKNLEYWTQFSLEVDCCLTPILEVGELESYPYMKEKNLANTDGIAPKLGENTIGILKSLLKKSDEELKEYIKKGIILGGE